ncbi:MAG TPA: sodium:proton antiporter [Steroidobacteraceae bacterium]|jgi:CPA1 family monovalent cation:H+ antiporter|nr:sodium:proton antiporter [Steroidobacteraceae bacterium]
MHVFTILSAVITVVALSGYANYKLVHLPDTIGITAVALLISAATVAVGQGVPQVTAWGQLAVRALDFPDLVFHGLLGLLLFAGSLHVDVAGLARARWLVLVMATVGVVISTVLVGLAFFYAARFLGMPLTLLQSFIFGALISPTDPIAAMGLLSKAGVPPSLLTKITGEALFNDGTGVVAFVVLLGIAGGAHGLDAGVPGMGSAAPVPGTSAIALLFAQQVLGGAAFGLAVGYLGILLLRSVDSYPVETLITLAMATGGYAAADALKISAPIATVVMGLVVGSGREYAMSELTCERLFMFWELADDLLNLILFGLVGLELTALAGTVRAYLIPAAAALPIVLIARYVSVAVPVAALSRFQRFEPHTVKLMTWAGLRGALSVALALSLPEGRPKELIVTATYLVAIFSILVQAPTVEPLARRWLKGSTQANH